VSAEIVVELNELLVAQLDKFDDLLHQRTVARDAAVLLEQENAHLHDLADEAADLLLSMRLGCLCTTRDLHIVRCEKHRLADLLEKMCDA
jgi:hypothetical protein